MTKFYIVSNNDDELFSAHVLTNLKDSVDRARNNLARDTLYGEYTVYELVPVKVVKKLKPQICVLDVQE